MERRPGADSRRGNISGQFTQSMSHRVGLTTHGKGEVKFVNCTEIHAVHSGGTALVPSPPRYANLLLGRWFPVRHRDPGLHPLPIHRVACEGPAARGEGPRGLAPGAWRGRAAGSSRAPTGPRQGQPPGTELRDVTFLLSLAWPQSVKSKGTSQLRFYLPL